MTFGLSAAAIAGIGVGVSAIGTGISAASAAGAFNGSVDSPVPTGAEIAATKAARQSYALGRKIQAPLDQMSRDDLHYLQSKQALANAGSAGVNQVWQQPIGQGLYQTAATTGGPGSGRWWGQMGAGTAAVDARVKQANAQGRLSGLGQYVARQGQFLDRRTNDLKTGMDTMSLGAAQAAQNQAARIQSQIQNNAARSAAMSQLGGSVAGMGSGMMGIAGAMSGGVGAASVMDGLFI